MKISNYFFAFSMLLACCAMLPACKKFVQIDSPPDLVASRDVFSYDETAEAAMLGVYQHMVNVNLSLTNGGLSVYLGLAADELQFQSADQNYDMFFSNALQAENSVANNFWAGAYRAIYMTNAIVEGLEGTANLTENLRQQLLGEALLARGFHYFLLVNLFGDVPLILETNYRVNAEAKRTSQHLVYNQVLEDLLSAEKLLKAEYPSQGKLRPNRYTVLALLARVYLYLEDWQAAKDYADMVVNSGGYKLSALESSFSMNNEEAIWQLMRDNGNTAEALAFIPFNENTVPPLSLTSALLGVFEQNDQRKANWTMLSLAGGSEQLYPFKYKVRINLPVSEYLTVFRLAEQYLIRAEANLKLGNPLEALEDLNVLRSRAGNRALASIDENVLNSERQREFFCEWGHRWFDLKRQGIIDSVLMHGKDNWKPFAALLPVPQGEILLNPALGQNAGY